MSYDISIMGPDGRPLKEVNIGVGEHHEIFNYAERYALTNMLHFSDYYIDGELPFNKAQDIMIEIETLVRMNLINSEQALKKVNEIYALLEVAKENECNVYGISD